MNMWINELTMNTATAESRIGSHNETKSTMIMSSLVWSVELSLLYARPTNRKLRYGVSSLLRVLECNKFILTCEIVISPLAGRHRSPVAHQLAVGNGDVAHAVVHYTRILFGPLLRGDSGVCYSDADQRPQPTPRLR